MKFDLENLKTIKRFDELDKVSKTLVPDLELDGLALATKGGTETSRVSNQKIYVYVIPKNTHLLKITNVSVPPVLFRRYTWDVCAFFEKTGNQSDFSAYEYISHGAYSMERYVREVHGDDRPLLIQMDYCRHFSWENDKVYGIAISSKSTPNVEAITYKTEGELYFDEEPVAEAIFDGKKLYESRIMCEKVVDDGRVVNRGFFLWNDEQKVVRSNGKDYVLREAVYFKSEIRRIGEIDDVLFFRDPKSYKVSNKKEFYKRLHRNKVVGKCSICVPVFPNAENRFGSYVWSKNVDSDVEVLEKNIDLRKDPYCNENLLKYNSHHLYSKLFDGFSLDVLFPDYKSFAETTPKDAAWVIARNLLRMPKGRRYISIDNGRVLKSLMLGPIYLADEVDDTNNGQARLEKDYLCSMVYFDDDLGVSREPSGDVICGDGYFFYDAPIHLDNPKIKNVPDSIREKYKDLLNLLYRNPNVHMDGHDVNENISSCEAMRNFLDKIFTAVKAYGVEVDYVFCDFEVFRNTANDLRIKHRLLSTSSVVEESASALYDRVISPDADEVLPAKDEQKKKPTQQSVEDEIARCRKNNMWNALWSSLKRRKDKEDYDGYRDIFNKLKRRGYVITDSDSRLASVAISNVFQYGYLFSSDYAARRNVNIWDQVVLEYIAGLVDKFMMEPVRIHSPKMRCSLHAADEQKGFVHNSDIFERYLGGNVKLPPAMYSAPNIYMSKSQGIQKRCMDNWLALPDDDSPFANLVGTVNNVRSAVLSNGKKKIWPFVASSYYWVWKTFVSQKSVKKEFCGEDGKIKLSADELIDKCNEEINAQFAVRSHKYYRELLIHSWLCNPENMSAYLHFHDHGLTHTNTDHFVFKPSADGLTASFGQIYQEEYNQNAYEYIQSVVSEIQSITRNLSMKPVVSTLASETNPFLLTCVRIGSARLYRFTINDDVDVSFYPDRILSWKPIRFKRRNRIRIPVSKRYNFKFDFGGKQVSFHDSIILNCRTPLKAGKLPKNAPKGFWIMMPCSIVPKITTDYHYYQQNPSINVNVREIDFKDRVMGQIFANDSSATRLKWPGVVCVFGECARKQKMMTSVRFESVEGDKTVLGVKFKPKGHFKADTDYVFERSFDLDSPRDTDGCIYAPLVSDKFLLPASMNVDLEKDKPIDSIDILSDVPENVYWYKSFIQGMNFRVDLFRKNDGVNITRVNKACNAAYANLPVASPCGVDFKLRLSWLNATKDLHKYRIRLLFLPGRIKIFNRITMCFGVKSGGCGYRVLDIPNLQHSSPLLRITVEHNGAIENVYDIPINGR
ncbi:MAG: hypothetical protein J6Y14_05390 [Fibrobacter sp.]|nr:hypothetical protein [Fibrobacter sp.]